VNLETQARPAASAQATDTLELRLEAVRYAADGINLLSFARPDGGVLPAVEPGAHIGLFLPNAMERQYSVIDADPAPRSYTVGVKLDPNSRGGSVYIHEHLRVGTRIQVAPPRNNFPLTWDAAHTVLIAGGIGVTPIWCMAKALQTAGRSFDLHYACRRRAEAAFLHDMQQTGRLNLHIDEEHGGVLDVASLVAAAAPTTHLYCCGPTPMLTAFEAACMDRPPACVHVEYFASNQAPDLAGGYTVELARAKQSFVIPPGMSILHVLRNAGFDVASSCEEGVCGACETAVLAGVPDHRDVVLSEVERAENKTMFICCSGCKGDRLVLDL
jgi:ferredoxin-NADP reductase